MRRSTGLRRRASPRGDLISLFLLSALIVECVSDHRRAELLHLVGLRADVRLRVFESGDGAVAEAAHHRHQRVEVLQLQQLLWTDGGGKTTQLNAISKTVEDEDSLPERTKILLTVPTCVYQS